MDIKSILQSATNQFGIAILVAIIAAILKLFSDGLALRKANRLKRVDNQLALLYGPLLALNYAGEKAWAAFRSIHRPDVERYWDESTRKVTDYEALMWRTWIKEVFMPLNDKIEKLIVEHADLLEEDSVPPVLLDLCAHVEAYRGVIEQWKLEDLSRQWSVIDFPRGIKAYAEERYTTLKQQQRGLIQAVAAA